MSGDSIFITGATGFIGRRLLSHLDGQAYNSIYCLIRDPADLDELPGRPSNFSAVIGDLGSPGTYRECLRECRTAVHLAARTGKATDEEFFSTNASGTAALVEECERAGVENFLYLSTIAVAYPEIDDYPYAQSKAAGEEAVRKSGLKHLIVRPTIVLGQGGAIWNALIGLVRKPFLILPGTGRPLIQPVHVDDLARQLGHLAVAGPFTNRTIEIGGAEKLPFEEFLQKVNERYHGRRAFAFHLPLGPIIALLRLANRILPGMMPFNSGQFSAFRFDSCAAAPPDETPARPLDEMISDLLGDESRDLQQRELLRECDALAGYLIGETPNDYIRDKYLRAHEVSPALASGERSALDRLQMAMAVRSRLACRFADSYSSIFSRDCLLRKKIVLLLAVLESTHPTYRHFDEPQSGGRTILLGRLMLEGIAFVAVFILSSFIFLPLTLIDRLGGKQE